MQYKTIFSVLPAQNVEHFLNLELKPLLWLDWSKMDLFSNKLGLVFKQMMNMKKKTQALLINP